MEQLSCYLKINPYLLTLFFGMMAVIIDYFLEVSNEDSLSR
jgi:hypothetical protein